MAAEEVIQEAGRNIESVSAAALKPGNSTPAELEEILAALKNVRAKLDSAEYYIGEQVKKNRIRAAETEKALEQRGWFTD